MIIDRELMFSNAQAVTAQALSTDVVDTAPLGIAASAGSADLTFAVNTGRNVGAGQNLFIWVNVDVAMTDTGSDSTLSVELLTDDVAALNTSPVVVATLFIIPAVSLPGFKAFARIPLGADIQYQRYIGLRYTPNNGNLTTGSFSAGIVLDADAFVSYASGYRNQAG